MRRRNELLPALILYGLFLLCPSLRAQAQPLPDLPGPGLPLPVDLDGDGQSTFGDRYVFNSWLESGGRLDLVLANADVRAGVMEVAEFFHDPWAALSKDAGIVASVPAAAGGATQAPVARASDCTTSGCLLPPFDQHVTQVFPACCDGVLLSSLRGHALADGALFVARGEATFGGAPNHESNLDDLVFDPFSPSLFAAADRRIYRIRARAGAAPVPFADDLDLPRGISFPRSGVMLVSEESRDTLTVIDGWRFRFIRGDADGDTVVDISDARLIERWLFQGREEAGCWDAADADDNGSVNVSDAVFLLNHLFEQGPPPPAPFPDLGSDPTPDLLGCRTYHGSGAIDF